MTTNRRLIHVTRVVLSAVLALCIVASSCGDESPVSPSGPGFPLPADAPPDAAAPVGTTRVTITAIQFFAADGRVADPAGLPGDLLTRFRVWIYCPPGLEGSFDYMIPTSSFSAGPYQLQAGYNDVSDRVYIFTQPSSQRFRVEISRDLCLAVGSLNCGHGIVAFKEITLGIRP